MATVGLYGFSRGPAISKSSQSPATGAASADPSTSAPTLPPLPHTDDPLAYSDAVARALFVWDTLSGFTPDDYQSIVSEDADPAGIETSGLVNDLAVYLPTTTQWQQLRLYKTAERLTITRSYIPAAWANEVASAEPSTIRPGTTAVTIEAVRHRSGSWYGSPATTADAVSFTVFVACQPTFPRCHILRLSGLNTPLK
ncbi:hypothetical protein [Lacisediminihabitans profunda]|uniref:hypothetical protein n=1 Tax=Lacisediminihabitans profunda TaxID=2594790 RepID=UPI001C9D2FD4|nr:hypothetical protein [Lacisediminihabitans profunda]